jgi:predicted acyl esterase
MQSNRLFSPLILVLLALLALAAGPGSRARETPPVKARYTKHEYQIAMRDGVKLFTSVYVPKDASQKYPIMMQRTPYSIAPYGPDDYRDSLGPSPRFMDEGFIF